MNVLNEVKHDLLMVENPARYCGGEFHYGRKDPASCTVHVAICFPDLYEIGMSNHAIRILYDLLNRMDDVHCDRVFAVGKDFEELLRSRRLPLYTLDEGRPLRDLDMLGVSIGYELCMTNILQILDLGGIPLHVEDRKDGDPIVIAGGPASTNPLPFSRFIDFTFIGEAENGMDEVVSIIKNGKVTGKSREEIIRELKALDFLWYPGKKLARRRFDQSFATADDHTFRYFVVPNFKVAQDNGIVEIMRGCPNGCRFCHAGQYYKPYRQRSQKTIMEQVDQIVHGFGFREITLSSLSSGDYPHIKELIQNLNARYMKDHISFSLPSLKVSTFNLDVLEQLSEVRKSGLTFAIETPLKAWQQSVNKIVDPAQIIEIIREAQKRGWRLAKFYFMVGLPFVDREMENQAIVDYLGQIYDATRINMNINIGTFIPKPHTPYQWAKQLTAEESYTQLSSLKRAISERIRGCKVSYHEPYISYLEGLVSRGDGRFAIVIENAYKNGCRLDAWSEHMNEEGWDKAIADAGYDPSEAIYKEYDIDAPLPWDGISLRVGKTYLKNEWEKAKQRLLTSRCLPECDHACGVCTKVFKVVDDKEDTIPLLEREEAPKDAMVQVVIQYRREGRSLYISHINAMRNWEMSFQRSGLRLDFSQGFNPKPRMEFVNPLSLGVGGEGEVALCDILLPKGMTESDVAKRIQGSLTEGYTVTGVLFLPHDPTGRKQSLAPYMKGSLFTVDTRGNESYDRILCAKPSVERTDDHIYEIRTEGEANLVKTLFGPEANKFKIASDVAMTRKQIFAGTWDDDYFSFFRKKFDIQ
ncbi:MAG: TIGR03936 family radical SAM-associated protein [Sphaerochaetaceae bacterium]|jgi:radical SAM-linked protein